MRRILAAALCATLLTGCTTDQAFVVPLSGDADAAGRISAVDVRNARGSVTLRVDPGIESPVVRARPDSETTSLDAEAPGQDWVRAQIDQQPGGGILRIDAEHPDGPDAEHTVDLTITVPGTRSTTIRNAGGDVRVEGVEGSIDIRNGDPQSPGGNILVRTARPLRDTVTLESARGDIALSIAPDSAGDFALETPQGDAVFNSRRARLSGVRARPGWWSGSLNGGTNAIRLRAENGDARVNVVADPESVSFQNWFRGQTTE